MRTRWPYHDHLKITESPIPKALFALAFSHFPFKQVLIDESQHMRGQKHINVYIRLRLCMFQSELTELADRFPSLSSPSSTLIEVFLHPNSIGSTSAPGSAFIWIKFLHRLTHQNFKSTVWFKIWYVDNYFTSIKYSVCPRYENLCGRQMVAVTFTGFNSSPAEPSRLFCQLRLFTCTPISILSFK